MAVDKPKPESNKEDSGHKEEAPPDNPAIIPRNKGAIHQTQPAEPDKQKSTPLDNRTRLEFWFAAAIAISTVGQLFVSCSQRTTMIDQNKIVSGQLDTMQKQTAVMVDQVKLAEGQLKEAAKANEVARVAAKASQDSAFAARTSIELTRESNRAAKIGADAALIAALKSNEIAADTARKQLRAYIAVVMEPRPVLRYEPVGKTFSLELKLRNFGQTPAKRIHTKFIAKYLANGEKEEIVLEPINGDGMTIPPSGQWAIVSTVTLGEPPLNGRFVIRGRIEYLDEFGAARFTNFHYLAGPPIGPNAWDLNIEDGNDSN